MLPLITSDHEPTDACRAVSNGFANFHAGRRGSGDKARPANAKREAKRAAEGKGPSAAPGPSAETVEMSSAAHQREGQMRDGKRARPERGHVVRARA